MDYFESGFTVRTASWHGKETVLAEAPENWDEARMAAGLMWEPRIVPVYRQATDADGNPTFIECVSQRLVVRDDTDAELGGVSQGFELITHAEMGDIMAPVLDQPGCALDTMGSVRDGRMVYATVLLDEPYQIKGDVDGFGDPVLTLPYFAILNSHDGTGACKGLYTQTRVVCANTVQAAAMEGDRTGAQFILRHTSGVKERIADARDVVEGCRVEASEWKATAEALALIPITDEQQLQYLSEFIPLPPAGVTSDRVQDNVRKEQGKFLHLLRDSATNCEMQHTALGLVNASVEYLDHLRGFRDQDTYLARQLLRAEPLKAKALKLVRELVSA